jgi:hypothetical protein
MTEAIRAELTKSDIATAEGITVKAESPVLALCRKLIDVGYDPSTPLEAYRNGTLALRVKSIGQAAGLRVTADKTGCPIFKREEITAGALPMRSFRQAAE